MKNTRVRSHSRSTKGKGNITVKSHSRGTKKSSANLHQRINARGDNEQANAWHTNTKKISRDTIGKKMLAIDQDFKNSKKEKRKDLKASWKRIAEKRKRKGTSNYWE